MSTAALDEYARSKDMGKENTDMRQKMKKEKSSVVEKLVALLMFHFSCISKSNYYLSFHMGATENHYSV